VCRHGYVKRNLTRPTPHPFSCTQVNSELLQYSQARGCVGHNRDKYAANAMVVKLSRGLPRVAVARATQKLALNLHTQVSSFSLSRSLPDRVLSAHVRARARRCVVGLLKKTRRTLTIINILKQIQERGELFPEAGSYTTQTPSESILTVAVKFRLDPLRLLLWNEKKICEFV